MVHIYIYICQYIFICNVYIRNPEKAQKILLWTQLKRKWLSWKTRHRYARFVDYEENGCRFEGQRKETWIYTGLAWLLAVRDKLLKSSQTLNAIQVLDSRTIFNLAKVNTVPRMCAAALSFGQRVDGWIVWHILKA